MAQQTRLATIVPYFENWMRTFPRLRDVGTATEREILQIWEGLGYYRRALNLHKAARLIMAWHGGQVPATRNELLALPGVGRYTAGAILSLCFNQPEPAIDANVVRLFSRLLRKPLTQSRKSDIDDVDRRIRSLLRHSAAMPPGMLAEALMVLGSRVCLPRTPRCPECPLKPSCRTFAQGARPMAASKIRKADLPERHLAGFFLEAHWEGIHYVLLVRHPESDMLSGLWGFPVLPWPDPKRTLSLEEARLRVQQTLHFKVEELQAGPPLTQEYSHFKRQQRTYRAYIQSELPTEGLGAEFRWVPVAEIETYPMSVLDRKMAQVFLQKTL